MKKIYSFLLTAVMLLVSANTWAVTVTTPAALKEALEGESGTVTLGNKISFGTITGTTLSQSYIQITQYAKEYYYYNITGNITLDLAGYNLYGTVKYKSYLFYINPGASLTIINSSSTAATITPLNSYTATSDARFFLINDATAQLHLNSSNIYYKGANKSAYFYDSNTAKDVTAGYFSSTADAPQLAYDADNCALENTNTEVTISYTAAGDRFDVTRYWWKVEKMSSNFIVNGVECATVAAAVTASQNGTYPILLLKDVASEKALNADVTFDGATYKLSSSSEITKGVYNCQVSATNNVKGGTFNNAFSISGSKKYITGGVFANQPTASKIKTDYQAVSGNTNGKWAVAQTTNISDDKIAQGSYYDDVTDFVAATSTAIINTTINTTYAYKTYVFLNTNMEGGKVAGGVYTVNIPTSMIAAGYNLVTAKISTTNYYVIGKGAKVDGSGKIIAGTFKADPTPYVNTTDYQVTNNGSVYTVSMLPGHGEAFIGSQEYETLAEAIAAVPANNVETKITINRAVTSACSTIAKQNIVIDFNGKACTGSITNKGSLKLMDSSVSQAGGTTGIIYCNKNGVLIIESGKYGRISADANVSITINGGQFTASTSYVITLTKAYTVITDAGVATPYNKYYELSSMLTINGGTFTNTGTGYIIQNSGYWKVFINDGTFTTQSNNIIYCTKLGYPLHSEDEWYIHIAGGTYHSGTADPLALGANPGMAYPDKDHQFVRAWVTGGTFDKKQEVNDEMYRHFPMNTDLYELHDNGDGTWTVQVIPGDNRPVASGKYGTICLPRLVTKGNYSGATFYSIVGKQVNEDTFDDELVIEEVDDLEAGVPYIFEAEEATISYTYANEEIKPASIANGLVGTLEEITVPVSTVAEPVYAVTADGVMEVGVAGLILNANRAYIRLDLVQDMADAPAPVAGRRRVSMSTNGTTVVTGVEQTTATSNAGAQKVLMNGRVCILRGEHVYDMTGKVIR